MWIGTQADCPRLAPSEQFELLLWGISCWFPLANHFDLSGSQSICGIRILSCECTHLLAKVDSTEEVLWVEHPLTLLPAFACKEPRRMCDRGGLLTSGVRNKWFEQGPASSFNCPAILILEWSFSLLGMNLQSLYLGGVAGAGCPSTSYLKSWREKFEFKSVKDSTYNVTNTKLWSNYTPITKVLFYKFAFIPICNFPD